MTMNGSLSQLRFDVIFDCLPLKQHENQQQSNIFSDKLPLTLPGISSNPIVILIEPLLDLLLVENNRTIDQFSLVQNKLLIVTH
jgi:hypothetical protein